MNKNFSSKVVLVVKPFTGDKAKIDKNGLSPVFLKVISGKAPNRAVIPGTIADNEGFEMGGCYLASITEEKFDETHGRQFVYTRIKELNATEIMDIEDRLGNSIIFDVTKDGAANDLEDVKKAEKDITNA